MPGEQERRIHAGQFGTPRTPTALHIEEVIIEASIAGGISLGTVRCIGKEAERRQCALHGGVARHEAAFDTHRISRQCQSNGGDAPLAIPLATCQAPARWRN